MKRTRVCDIFGLEYPIVQGGMSGVSCPELAAAVSDAGGLGLLTSTADVPTLRQQIRRTRELTNRPFGVNVPMFLAKVGGLEGVLRVVLEEGVGIVATAAGNPLPTVPQLKEAGLKVMHVVASTRAAKRAEEAGADAVIAEGFEAGGLLGRDQVTTLTLVPQVVDAVKVPVIAAGGIADARGLVAAFALGAEGVQMGTRFIATVEAGAPETHKQAVLAAGDTDTLLIEIPFGYARLLKPEVYGGAAAGVPIFMGITAGYAAGQAAGLIRATPTVREVIAELVRGFERVVAGLQ